MKIIQELGSALVCDSYESYLIIFLIERKEPLITYTRPWNETRERVNYPGTL